MASKVFIVSFADDREPIEVTPTLQDTLAFETTLRRNPSWGKLDGNILRMAPYRCWNALKRTGRTELTWAEFVEQIADCVSKQDEGEDEDPDEVPGLGKGSKTALSTKPSSPSPSAPASPTASGDEKPEKNPA